MKIRRSGVFERSFVCAGLELLDCKRIVVTFWFRRVLVLCFLLRIFNVQV